MIISLFINNKNNNFYERLQGWYQRRMHDNNFVYAFRKTLAFSVMLYILHI